MRKQHSLCAQKKSSKRETNRELSSQVVMETTQKNAELTPEEISLLFNYQNVFKFSLVLPQRTVTKITQNPFGFWILKVSTLHKHIFHWWVLSSFTENSLLALLCCGRLTDKCTSKLWGSLCQVSISHVASFSSKGKRLCYGDKMQGFFLKTPCASKSYLKHTHFICILCLNALRQTEKTIPKPA